MAKKCINSGFILSFHLCASLYIQGYKKTHLPLRSVELHKAVAVCSRRDGAVFLCPHAVFVVGAVVFFFFAE